MATKPLKVHTAFVGTKEKLKDRFLFIGKIPKDESLSSFAFYIIEVLSPWHPSTKIEKIISTSLKNNLQAESKFDLEEALRQINEELGVLANKGESDWIGNLNALIGYVENNKDLHLSMAGNILGYMIRGGKVVTLTEGLGSDDPTNPLKTFENITSGRLGKGDQMIVANIAFYDYLSVDRLRRLLIEYSSKAAAKEIHRLLRKSRAKEVSAAIFDILDEGEKVNDNELEEFYWVDQAVDTPFNKFLQAAKPVAKKALKKTGEYSKKAYEACKSGAKSAHKNLRENVAPKTKDLLSKSASKMGNSAKGFKKHKIDEVEDVPNNLNVKSYRNKNKSNNTLKSISNFFVALWKLIKPIFRKENRRYLYITIAIILIVVGYFKVRANNLNREQLASNHELEDSLNEANDLFNQAKEDIALGRDGGEEKLLSALSTAESALDSTGTKDKATELRKKILEEIDDLTGTIRIWDIEPIFEIKGEIVKSILVGETIYSVTDEGRIYATDTRDNTPALIASVDADSGKVLDMAFSDSLDKIYIYKENQKVFSLDTSTETISEVSLASAELSFEKSVALDAYVTNLYLLDSDNGEVWKHTSSDGAFGKGSAYLDTRTTSIKGAVDLAIDGNIFVLMNDGSIQRFVRGAFDQDFNLGAIPAPNASIESPKQIFSDADTNYIYILDSNAKRIVKFEKNGTYANQYAFESIDVNEILINPRVQKIWIENDNKYYELSM